MTSARSSSGNLRAWCSGFVGLAVALGAAAVPTQEPAKIKIGNLGFPSHSAMIISILKDKGFDRKHGIDMEVTWRPEELPGLRARIQAMIQNNELDPELGRPQEHGR